MEPQLDRTKPVPFYLLGAIPFQRLCRALLRELPKATSARTYGKEGQSQHGIDILVTLDSGELWAGQSKAYAEYKHTDLKKTVDNFKKHLEYWKKRGLKRFIILVGSGIEDRKVSENLPFFEAELREHGVDLRLWDSDEITRQLSPFPQVVKAHIQHPYYLDRICGIDERSVWISGSATIESPALQSIISELGEGKNEQLDQIRDRIREGNVAEAESQLRKLRESQAWSHLPNRIRARTLRLHAGLVLNERQDTDIAKKLIAEAKEISPSDRYDFHDAVILQHERGPEEALQFLNSPESADEWHLRAALLISAARPDDAITLLSSSEFEQNAETLRLRAVAKLMLKQPLPAKIDIERALESSPSWFRVQETAGKIFFYSAVAPAAPGWGTWEFPPPIGWEYIKTDDSSATSLASAEAIFAELAERDNLSEETRLMFEAWVLGCYAIDPDKQSLAEELARSRIEQGPLSAHVIGWAIERGYKFPREKVKLCLQQLVATTPSIQNIQTLFALHCDLEEFSVAGQLLDTHRDKFEVDQVWKSQRAQVAAINNERALLGQLLNQNDETTTRALVARTQAGKNGWNRELLSTIIDQYQISRHASALFLACEAHHLAGKPDYVLSHAEELLNRLPTERVLRLVLGAAFAAGAFGQCLQLSDQRRAIFRGGDFPSDIRRLRSRCYSQLGQFYEAENEIRQILINESTEDRFELFNLQLKSGDAAGAIQTARSLIDSSNITAEGLLHIADQLTPDDLHLAQEAFQKAEEIGIQDANIAAYAVNVGFHLGIDHKLGDLIQLAVKGIGDEKAVLQPLDLTDFISIEEQWRAAQEEKEEKYRMGAIPTHTLAGTGNCTLAALMLLAPALNRESDLPPSSLWALRVRHGCRQRSRIRNANRPRGGVFLDVTSILMLYSLELLNVVENHLSPISISSSTLAWLQEEISALSKYQISKEAAKRLVLEAVDSEKIAQIAVNAQGSPIENRAVEDQKGREWSIAAGVALDGNGILVDFLPLTKTGISQELAVLPDDISNRIYSVAGVTEALFQSGVLSSEEKSAALAKLGHEQVPTTTAQLQQGSRVVLQRGQAELLAYAGIFGSLADFSDLFIRDDEVEDIRNELLGLRRRKYLCDRLKSLRTHLRLRIEDKSYRTICVEDPSVQSSEGNEVPLVIRCLKDTIDRSRSASLWTCVDDRMISRIDSVGGSKMIGTIDLLGFFAHKRILSRSQIHHILHLLRAGNIRYIPTTSQEIVSLLNSASIRGDRLVETAELASLRRYFAACLFDSESLQQLPPDHPEARRYSEALVLAGLLRAVYESLVAIWADSGSSEERRILQSDWILESLWIDSAALPSVIPGFKASQGLDIMSLNQLVNVSLQVSDRRRGKDTSQRYLQWLFSRLGSEPFRWNSALAGIRDELIQLARKPRDKDAEIGVAIIYSELVESIPSELRSVIAPDDHALSVFRGGLFQPVNVGPLSFDAHQLWDCCARAVNGEKVTIETKGSDSEQYTVSAEQNDDFVCIKFESVTGERNFSWSDLVLCLLLPDSQKRRSGIAKARKLLDVPLENANSTFDALAKIDGVSHRIAAYQEMEHVSFPRQINAIRDHIRQLGSFDLDLARPRGMKMLLRFLRLSEDVSWTSLEQSLEKSAQVLLTEEGFSKAFIRCSCLPFRLPAPIRVAFSDLDEEERKQFVDESANQLPPLLSVHLASLLLEGNDSDRRCGHELLSQLVDSKSTDQIELFGKLLSWSYMCLVHDEVRGTWSDTATILAAWIYAGRLHHLLGTPAETDDLSGFFESQTPSSAKLAFSPSFPSRNFRIHPLRFTALSFRIGVISHFLASNKLAVDEPDSISRNLKSVCFPYPATPDLPDLRLYDISSSNDEITSFMAPEKPSNLTNLSGLGNLMQALGSAKDSEMDTLLSDLVKNPESIDRWTMVGGIFGKSVPSDDQAELLKKALAELTFRRFRTSPDQLLHIAFFVFDLARIPKFRESSDWTRLLGDFGDAVLSPQFSGDQDRTLEVCLNSLLAVSLDGNSTEQQNAQRFEEAARSLAGDKPFGLAGIRRLLASFARRQDGATFAPVWRLLVELRGS